MLEDLVQKWKSSIIDKPLMTVNEFIHWKILSVIDLLTKDKSLLKTKLFWKLNSYNQNILMIPIQILTFFLIIMEDGIEDGSNPSCLVTTHFCYHRMTKPTFGFQQLLEMQVQQVPPRSCLQMVPLPTEIGLIPIG